MRKRDIIKLLHLETERTIIRQPTLGDLDAIQHAKESREADLRRWMCWSNDHGMSRVGAEEWIKLQYEDSTNLGLSVFDKTTGEFIMATGMDGEDEDFQVIHSGYWIIKSYEGKGIAFEVMSRIFDFAFKTVNVERIEMQFYEGNTRSRNLMERLGMTYDSTDPKAHTSHLTGEKLDVIKYRTSRTGG